MLQGPQRQGELGRGRLEQDREVMTKEVGIIVPAYNEEQGIGQVLEQL